MKYQPCFFPTAKPAGQGKESVFVLDVGLGATVLLGSPTMHAQVFWGASSERFFQKGYITQKLFLQKRYIK